MSKTVKIFLIIAGIFIMGGIVVGGVGYVQGGMQSLVWERPGLRVVNYEDASEMERVDGVYPDVKNIIVKTEMLSQVKITRGDELSVKGRNPKIYGGISAELDGDTLTVTSKRSGIDLVGLGGGIFGAFGAFYDNNNGYVEIAVPEGVTLNKVQITANLPKITVTGLNAGELNASCDMGSITISETNTRKLRVDTNMGAVKLESCTADDLMVSANMGELKMDNVTAGYAALNLDAGSAELFGFESGGLTMNCAMGSVELAGILKGKSDISCDMGSIKLDLDQPESSLSLDIEADLGDAYVNGHRVRNEHDRSVPHAEGELEVSSDMGSIRINFQ
ncbi:MAG: DUF4097 domain-containing protein [Clostridiales Family XIII bacterium]|jgi:hypothetical protein|nr:DUF4097 domain-containing protein [Clostridiales Family XIII bacterium]